MVGSPKRLADLAQIEANLAVRCRACGKRRAFDVGLLGRHLVAERRNSTWSELPRSIPCLCGSIDLSLKPVPFAASTTDPEMGRYDRALVAAAVEVLSETERRSFKIIGPADPVRLALRVLLPWSAKKLLVAYWDRFEAAAPEYRCPTLTSAREAIERELRMLGRLAAAGAADGREILSDLDGRYTPGAFDAGFATNGE